MHGSGRGARVSCREEYDMAADDSGTDDGPIHKLYRVSSFPAYFLIGRDGKLASRRLQGGAEDEILAWAERLASAGR